MNVAVFTLLNTNGKQRDLFGAPKWNTPAHNCWDPPRSPDHCTCVAAGRLHKQRLSYRLLGCRATGRLGDMASLTDLVAAALQTHVKKKSEMLGQFWPPLVTSVDTTWSWRVLVDPVGLQEGRGSPLCVSDRTGDA